MQASPSPSFSPADAPQTTVHQEAQLSIPMRLAFEYPPAARRAYKPQISSDLGIRRLRDAEEGQGDLVSRLITPITHIVTPIILVITLLTKSL